MPDAIIDGSGGGVSLVVSSGGFAIVGGMSGAQHVPFQFTSAGALRTDASVSVGSINTGSESFLYGLSSGTSVWNPLMVESGTGGDPQRLVVAATLSAADVHVVSGAVFVVSGNSWLGVGSVLVSNPSSVGSLSTQMVTPSGSFFVSASQSGTWTVSNAGSVVVTNQLTVQPLTGSIYGIGVGSVYAQVLGSVAVSNLNQNIFVVSGNTWLGVGSVLVTNSIDLNGLSTGILSTQTSIGSTVEPLLSSPLASRKTLSVQNVGTNVGYIGGSPSASGNGFPIKQASTSTAFDGGNLSVDLASGNTIWGYSPSGTTFAVVEVA